MVVDACVARAAGGADASSIEAKACRDVLVTIYEVSLRLVMSKEIGEEWRRHQSNYSRKWLHQMFGRKRVDFVQPSQHQPIRIAMRAHLVASIQRIVEKDLHVIEAALATDRRIVSQDDTSCLHLGSLAPHVPELKHLHWANPTSTECIGWLQQGAPESNFFCVV